MAFIDMPRKVRPWKRGLAGLGDTADDLTGQALFKESQARVKRAEAASAWTSSGSTEANNEADRLMLEAADLHRKAAAARASKPAASSPSYPPEVQAALAQRAAAEAQARAASAAAAAAKLAGKPTMSESVRRATTTAPRTSAPGNVAYDIKEDPKYYTKTVDASGNAVYRKVDGGGGTTFSDVLASVAEVVGVAAPVADRIVASEQARKAETLARRAERAAQNGLLSASTPPPSGGFPTSTVVYGVGGVVAVGAVLWGLSSLLGGSK